MTSVLGVIPARYASSRFPGKPLALISGKPMIEWVYTAARRSLRRVIVATDDKRIFNAVKKFGGEALMTPASCATGTERMAVVARTERADFYVNIQGDEPLIKPETIRATVALALKRNAIATPVTDLDRKDFQNPNVVKVALGKDDRALYFSRSLIPFPREGRSTAKAVKHVGLYVYPRHDLLRFVTLRPTRLEKTEMLEQLRAIFYGIPIFAAKTRFDSVGVDTPADLKRVMAKLKFRHPGMS